MSEEFRTYHARAGFTLPVPVDWETTEEVEGCALVAAPPTGDPQGFLPNVVVTVEQLTDLEETWVRQSREALGDQLMQLRIIDTEETQVGGMRAWRTLSHYMHPRGGVNLEQWAAAWRGWGYVVSCSMSSLDYDDLADTMTSIAEGLRLEEKTS